MNPPVQGTRCVGKGVTGDGVCLAVYSAPGGAAPARDPQTPPAPASVPLGNGPAPAPRATLGAALTLARGAQSGGAGSAAPGPAVPPAPAPPEPNSWQRLASRKLLRLLFLANDKVMELRKREPTEDAPEDDDPEFSEAARELSLSLAIWFPATALPPWGNAAVITAGMLADRWIMSTPVEDEEKPPAARAPVAVGATAAATKPATPPPATKPADSADALPMELG